MCKCGERDSDMVLTAYTPSQNQGESVCLRVDAAASSQLPLRDVVVVVVVVVDVVVHDRRYGYLKTCTG